ncbi:MAG: REP-associated tyrosine transposase [Candidatus Kryptoniota bacterium]
MKEVVSPGDATFQSGDLKDADREISEPREKKEIGGPRGNRQIVNPREKQNADREISEPRGNQEIVSPTESGPRWHSRGYLPHFECNEVIQHVTFHLADSLPKNVVERMEEELRSLPIEEQDPERRRRIDEWIDAGHGSCVLREPAIAKMVQDSFFFFDGQRYRLLAWVIMPNHVHVLFPPINNWTVAKIVASWKKFTGRRISDYLSGNPEIGQNEYASQESSRNQSANRETGGPRWKRIWHREYWDRYIRDEEHFCRTIEYVHQNPVKAGLVEKPEEWQWSSAAISVKRDDQESGIDRKQSADREIGDPREKLSADQEISGRRKGK